MRAVRDALACAQGGDVAAQRLAGSWTLVLVGRPRALPGSSEIHGLAGKGTLAGGGQNYGIDYYDNGGTATLRAGFVDTGATSRTVSGAIDLTVGSWYTVAAAWDGTTLSLWYALWGPGGELVAPSTLTLLDSATPGAVTPESTGGDDFVIGAQANASTLVNGADWDFAEVFLLSSALTKAGVEATLGTRRDVDQANAVGLWPFDEMRDSTAYDVSGTGNDLTLTEAARWVLPPAMLRYSVGDLPSPCVAFLSGTLGAGSTVTASDEDSSYPATALRSVSSQVRTRTTDVSGAKTWVVYQPEPVPVWVVGLRGHNLTSAATVTIEGHTADSWGAPTLGPLSVTYHPRLPLLVLSAPHLLAYWRLSVTDAANPDGYLEIGALDLWCVWEHSASGGTLAPRTTFDRSSLSKTALGALAASRDRETSGGSGVVVVTRDAEALEIRRHGLASSTGLLIPDSLRGLSRGDAGLLSVNLEPMSDPFRLERVVSLQVQEV